MRSVRLGRTGLQVSEVCLGTGGYSRLGTAYPDGRSDARAVIDAAIDRGVTFIDTAAAYDTESIVGGALRGRRDQVVISTKNHIVQPGTSIRSTRHFVDGATYKRALEGNLRRLGTDYVDILYCHGIVPRQYDYCRAEIVPAMQELRDEGKIRVAGISEQFLVDTQHETLLRAVQDDCFDVLMLGLNFVNQTALRQVLPAATAKGIGTQVIYAMRRRLVSLDAARKLVAKLAATGEVRADLDGLLDRLATEGGSGGLPAACCRFTRYAPGVDTIAVGTGNPAHLLANIDAVECGPLPDELIDELGTAFGAVTSASGD